MTHKWDCTAAAEGHQGTSGGRLRFRQPNCAAISTQVSLKGRTDARRVRLGGGGEATGGDKGSVHVVKNIRPNLTDIYETVSML